MPFGGVKSSGYGRFGGGKAVINEFTDLRWITIEGPQSCCWPLFRGKIQRYQKQVNLAVAGRRPDQGGTFR
jgi:hypothetical protein